MPEYEGTNQVASTACPGLKDAPADGLIHWMELAACTMIDPSGKNSNT